MLAQLVEVQQVGLPLVQALDSPQQRVDGPVVMALGLLQPLHQALQQRHKPLEVQPSLLQMLLLKQ